MASEQAERFMSALKEAEETGDAGVLVALFSEDADIANLAGPQPRTGQQGARSFWTSYLAVFPRVRSRFTHVAEGDQLVVLEWVSDGTLEDGSPVSYQGVSILEMDEGLVRRFRTYYDSAALKAAAVPARGVPSDGPGSTGTR